MATRALTEQQKKFLEVLYEEAAGDVLAAKRLAGYSDNSSTTAIVDSMSDEIYEATKKFLSRTGVKAAWAMSDLIDNPTTPGSREKLAAAKDVLDRANFKPADKVEVSSESPIFMLPEKKKDEAD